MKKYFNLYVILGLSSLFLFVLLVILLNFDKAVIAESNEAVGMSHINNIVSYKYVKWVDKLSDVFFYLTFIVVACAIGLGIYQLVKNKSLAKVDKEIIIFGVFLVIAVGLWLSFDYVFKLNIRPTHEAKGSFPSTHVFLTTFFTLACHGYLCKKFKGNQLIKYLSLCVAIVFIVLMLITRVAAGMNYITDVTGGLFLGLSLYFLTFGISKYFVKEEQSE